MGVCECHERWKSHIFIGSNLRCREMVGIDNKLLDELRHIQVWIVLTGYWEAAVYTWSHIFISRLILCTNSMSCLRKGGKPESFHGRGSRDQTPLHRLNHSSL